MPERRVHLGRLTIRLRGVSPDTARDAGRGLGAALLHELARLGTTGPPRSGGRIDRVDSGHALVTAGAAAADLRRVIVDRIAAAMHRTGR